MDVSRLTPPNEFGAAWRGLRPGVHSFRCTTGAQAACGDAVERASGRKGIAVRACRRGPANEFAPSGLRPGVHSFRCATGAQAACVDAVELARSFSSGRAPAREHAPPKQPPTLDTTVEKGVRSPRPKWRKLSAVAALAHHLGDQSMRRSLP